MVRVHFGPPLLQKTIIGVKTGTIESQRRMCQNGLERRHLATCRWHVATAVAFPQKSESLAHHFYKSRWIWGFSSAGRAPALQAGGQRFDPANLHHFFKELTEIPLEDEISLNFLGNSRCTLKTEHCNYDAIMRRQQ